MKIIKGKVGTGNTDYENSPRILLDVNISDRLNMLENIKNQVIKTISESGPEKTYYSETGPDDNDRDYTPRNTDANDVINIFGNKITSAYQYQRVGIVDFDFNTLTITPTPDIVVKQEYDKIYIYRYFKDKYEPITLNILSRNEIDEANWELSNFNETYFSYETDANDNTVILTPNDPYSEEIPITTYFRLYSSDTNKTIDVYVFAYTEYYACYTSRALGIIETNAKCYTDRTIDIIETNAKCYTDRTLERIESNAKCYTSRALDIVIEESSSEMKPVH